MANRRAMKLFAVAVLAGTSTAHADTTTQATARSYGYGGVQPRVDWSGKIDIYAIKPRELANGRAAPGNTVGKQPMAESGPSQTAEQAALLAASLAYQAVAAESIVINPRLLGNARPACGNTGGKVDRPDNCTAKEIRAVEAYNREYARLSGARSARSARIEAASTKLMAATVAAVRADPSLKARLLVNGRPACGNTMGKSSPPSYCRIGDEQ